jgi:hypothetical protein
MQHRVLLPEIALFRALKSPAVGATQSKRHEIGTWRHGHCSAGTGHPSWARCSCGMSTSVPQTNYDLMCRVLRQVLHDAVQAGPGAAGGIGIVEWRAVAALCLLLLDHPIDQRGRCRSCRRLGAVFGLRWRCCRVYVKAALWLRQPEDVLRRLLAHELGLAAAAPSADSLLTPAVPSAPIPPAGQPDPDHGGAGDDPESPRSRRGPSG